jgi:hypothetical protein
MTSVDWIECSKESRPESGETVLLAIEWKGVLTMHGKEKGDGFQVVMGTWGGTCWLWWDMEDPIQHWNVTHWAPLPSHPLQKATETK